MVLDDNLLHTLATKSIIESITPEAREALLERAVKGLFEVDPNQNVYKSDKRTRFEKSFDDALTNASALIVRDLLKEERYQTALRSLVSQQIEKLLFGEDAGKLASLISAAFDAGMTKLRERY